MAQVRLNEAANRYEMEISGNMAVAEYRREGDIVTLTHTKVPQELEGKGIASTLIAGALADLRGRGLTIVPACPFVARYVERHKEVQDLVAK